MKDYSNVIIPINLISGMLLVEKNSLFKKINPVGVLLIFSAFFFLYHQLETRREWDSKNSIPFILFPVSYLLGIFGEISGNTRILYFSNLLFFISVFLICITVTEGDLNKVENQKIIIYSLFLVSIIIFYLPKYRKRGDIFSFTLSSLIFFSLLFTTSLLEGDHLHLKKNLDKNVKTRDNQ